jgi:hypothetical protein
MQCSMIDLHNHYIAFEAIDSTVGLMEQNGSGEGRTPVQTFPIRESTRLVYCISWTQ